ncbi:MAG: glycosyltransferase family protein [Gaiellaceae bacterium]
MRVLVVDTCYPAFLASHYAGRPGLSDAPYEQQWRALMDTFFGTADAYSHYLGAIGHDAHELVVNAEPLQNAWAREHGIRRPLVARLRRRAGAELVLAQAEWFQPDVVYVQNLGALSPETLEALRDRSRLLVGQIASEPPGREQLEQFDLILTSFPHFADRFRNLGIASEYFRIGFDPRVLDRLGPTDRKYGAVFVGALGRLQHARGNDLLERAAERTAIEFWGYAADDRPPDSALMRHYHGEAWGIDMFRVLGESRIAVNRHIDVAEDYANNMRLYEATGVGALLLTDAKQNLGELFADGEVVAYHGEDELVQMIDYYLAHEDERRAVADAGQRRTLTDHTYAVRMKELAEILGRYLC